MNSKKKKTIAIVVAVVIVLIVGIFAIVKATGSDVKLKTKNVEVEYGNVVSTNPEDYLDLEKIKDKEAYLKEVTVTKDTKLEKGKKYEALGEYEVTIKDKKNEEVVKVTVKDTTKPKFNKVEKIETFAGEKVEYKEYVKAKDLQKVTLSFDDKEVKINKKGTYVLKAEAIDGSENKAEKEIKVVVKEKPKTNSNEKIETTVDKKGNIVSKVVNKNNSGTNVKKPSTNKSPSVSSPSKKPSVGSKPSKKPSVSKPSKPSKPQGCGSRHDGFKPFYGGWTKSYAQIEEWFWEYVDKKGIGGGAYGVHTCSKCGAKCINDIRYK